MTEQEIKAICDRLDRITPEQMAWSMNSGCTDYACYCHFDLPKVLDEVRRLRAIEQRLLTIFNKTIPIGVPKPSSWQNLHRLELMDWTDFVYGMEQLDMQNEQLRQEVATLKAELDFERKPDWIKEDERREMRR